MGSARARLRGVEGATRESVAGFEQAVLRALEETENALVAYRAHQQRLVKLAEQARESSRAAGIARTRYREGVADFLQLLDAQRTELQAQDAVAQAEAGVFTSVVAVYKALGGISEAPRARRARKSPSQPPALARPTIRTAVAAAYSVGPARLVSSDSRAKLAPCTRRCFSPTRASGSHQLVSHLAIPVPSLPLHRQGSRRARRPCLLRRGRRFAARRPGVAAGQELPETWDVAARRTCDGRCACRGSRIRARSCGAIACS